MQPGGFELGLVQRLFFARQMGLDGPVQQQVGVAADRAGEMGVAFIGQPVVAQIVAAIEGLHHRAQQHGVDAGGVDAVAGGFDDVLVIGLGGIFRKIQPHQPHEVADFLHLGGLRRFVVAVQHRQVMGQRIAGGADVGQQHAFLDQPVRIVAGARLDRFDRAQIVEDHVGFGGFKLHRPTLAAQLQQHPEQLVQCIHRLAHAVVGGQGLAVALQVLVHLRVGQSRL